MAFFRGDTDGLDYCLLGIDDFFFAHTQVHDPTGMGGRRRELTFLETPVYKIPEDEGRRGG